VLGGGLVVSVVFCGFFFFLFFSLFLPFFLCFSFFLVSI